MKHSKIILSIAIAIFSFTAVNAQATKAKTNKVKTDKAVYQCPMKCEGEKTYTKEGKCPVCNMNLKALPKPTPVVYQCPMKCEGEKTYAKEGKCPVCNMKLDKHKLKKETAGHEGHNHK